MKSPLRLGTALTTIGFIAAISGCAMPGHHKLASASTSAGKLPTGDAALATRAMIALSSNDLTNAVALGERAVEKSPKDAAIRTLLGNAYLASGRYQSAAAAYRDSLYLDASQTDVLLKLALVETSLGHQDEAVQLLRSGSGQLDASDMGLALALAGQPEQAVAVLEPVARDIGATARTRQNLALAYALSGNWTMARTVAAQDVPADQLDTRLHQWMAMASPTQRSTQVATFIGIAPAGIDPGQPTRLALVQPLGNIRQAEAAPVAAPVAVAPAPVEMAAADPVQAAPVQAAPVEATPSAPVETAVADPVITPLPAYYSAPSLGRVATATVKLMPRAPRLSLRTSRPGLSLAAARITPHDGHSRTVVQLGAYSSQGRIGAAWTKAMARNAALKGYTPVSARFAATHGIFYRLSVHGFASNRDAISLCANLKRRGTNCFVRSVAGDAPVSIATHF